ncbi:hypothetical protein ROR02_00870 [Pararhodospirillum oryzae]|uniref:AB hydrolase-1 domain-containing protein n=1 Tax=Pararhodospirillum oryzae TaxID=478448 RepID=A0A512H3C2_9PROT|nr:hypothetical protein ROR02_00870 [Pararhodospirillum oryzae]
MFHWAAVIGLSVVALLVAGAVVLSIWHPASTLKGPEALRWSPVRHVPTAMPLTPWLDETGAAKPFERTVADTRVALETARAGIDPDPVTRASHVNLVAPREWPLDESCGGVARAGVLLIHGLSDSPFTMRDLGTTLATLPERCLLVRSILLPGHGTVPGDLLRVDENAWRAAVRYGVESFADRVDRVHVVGYSLGATLAVDLVLNAKPTTPAVASLVLLAPALGADNRFPIHKIPFGFDMFAGGLALAAGFGPERDWLRIDEDLDFARYESFPLVSLRQLMTLMGETVAAPRPLPMPVFMAVAAEDSVIDTKAALTFFEKWATSPDSRLLLMAAPATLAARADEIAPLAADTTRVACVQGAAPLVEGCTPRAAGLKASCPFGGGSGACVTELGHLALPVAPGNPHYGRDGSYRTCLAYAHPGDEARYCGCAAPPQRAASALCQGVTPATTSVRLGEPTREQEKAQTPLAVRLTYNPAYARLALGLADFLK